MSEWQPIETAKRDKQPVLLRGGEDDCAIHVSDQNMLRLMRAPRTAIWTDNRWIVAWAEAGWAVIEYVNPKEWMPIPE